MVSVVTTAAAAAATAPAVTAVTRSLVAEDNKVLQQLSTYDSSSSNNSCCYTDETSEDSYTGGCTSGSEDPDTESGSSIEEIGREYQYLKDQVVLPVPDSLLTVRLASWLARIQTQGFSADALRAFIAEDVFYDDEDDDDEEEEEEEESDIWWDSEVVRVFDPYCDLSMDDVETILDGKTNASGDILVGPCTVKLHNGDEVYGTFRKGLRQGRGSISGANMQKYGLCCVRGSYKNGVLNGEGRAVLAPSGLHPHRGEVTLEGIFNDGFLEGPVRGLDEKGQTVFIGMYEKGLPAGPCWLAREGQGWLHGKVDRRGRFSGDNIAFVYPDLSTCIFGTFHNERLVSGRPSQICDVSLASVTNPVVSLEFSPMASSSSSSAAAANSRYSCSPSDRSEIPCDWLLADPYESVTVICRPSMISGAGDGLFAQRDIPKNTVISYYNGVRVLPGESYTSSSYSYQIYVDWVNTDDSPFIDIPAGCVDIANYLASLAHKANHSFNPNCRFVASDHPRFGRVPSLQTIKDVKKGEELMSHYKYDTALAPTWYQEAWARFHDRNSDFH